MTMYETAYTRRDRRADNIGDTDECPSNNDEIPSAREKCASVSVSELRLASEGNFERISLAVTLDMTVTAHCNEVWILWGGEEEIRMSHVRAPESGIKACPLCTGAEYTAYSTPFFPFCSVVDCKFALFDEPGGGKMEVLPQKGPMRYRK
jgi:hypothetical protein